MKRSQLVALLVSIWLAVSAAVGFAGPVSAQPVSALSATSTAAAGASAHTVTYDGYSFIVDGKRTYLWSGEFHYYRLPSPSLWLDIFQKMKAAGFNSTSLYFDWGYHSSAPGVYDFTGVRDVDLLLDMAEQAGLYVIARPGPYINAEVDGGGFPTWLSRVPGQTRTSDPAYVKYADQWQTQIDRIVKRHQLTDGGGSVIAYQVENEYYNGSAAGRTYMKHIEDKARADGITVPLTGNNNGTFNSGDAALDVDGADAYPQGFNCSNPTQWNGVPDISYDHVAGKPLYTAEFQGGAFDPWGGPGYDKCAQLINNQFADVFYKQNIAVGATAQSFYMLYGGTSWGWNAIPQNYTSYDYGAAIRETRELDPKYYQDKLIGYFTQNVTPLTKTDGLLASPTDTAALTDTARINPDTGTQFHTLRHSDSTATTTDSTHLSLDLGAHAGYTYDDTSADLTYAGTWSHVGADQNYTGGDYERTESFSDTADDSVSVPFTGSGITWVTSKADNHGIADVYLDGTKVATVDTYSASKQNQVIGYRARGLAAGDHTLKIVVDGSKNAASGGDFVVVDAIDLPTAGGTYYASVPQKSGTTISLDGRASKIIVANYDLGASHLQYSTSEIMTNAAIAGRDDAVLYGDKGSAGETVLHYASRPTVTVLAGSVQQSWNAASGDLRLNYTHSGLARVLINGGGTSRPLLLLLADKTTAETFWQQDTANGPVLVRGTHLLRTATSAGSELALTGDTSTSNDIEIFSGATQVSWNGHRVQTQSTTSGSRVGVLSIAQPVTLPALTDWKHQQETPEAQPGFDDSAWTVADHTTTNSVTTPGSLPVLFADDYNFHTGSTWYRGRFRADGSEKGITLTSQSGGPAGATSVWINGAFAGSATGDGSHNFTFPTGAVQNGADNVVSVLTVNMGHEEDYYEASGNKAARGLISARITGSPLRSVSWRLQGTRGGETGLDTTRGPLNTGGLYGERAGWSLPGYPDASWSDVSLPAKDGTPGVSWYRTTSTLNLPKNQDTSLGLTIADSSSRKYRAEIFVNGWELGNYVNYLGPQHSFPIPNGILNTNGRNTIAIAVWNLDGTTGGLGKISWTNYGSYASSLSVAAVSSPGYSKSVYAMPAAPQTAVSLETPDVVSSKQTFTATANVSVPAGAPSAVALSATLKAPSGWKVGRVDPALVARIAGGTTAAFRWTVTAPTTPQPGATLTATVAFTQRSAQRTVSDTRAVGIVPTAPPAGEVAVSSLPFVSSTNGWGPVERDTSNGEQKAGDGHTITIAGTTYAKGLGVNADSDVTLYTAGKCTHFTASVGVDDETGGAGTVTFSVLADGTSVYASPVLKGGQSALAIDLPLNSPQVLDLVVGDGGDGNGNDHGDWAAPVLTCS